MIDNKTYLNFINNTLFKIKVKPYDEIADCISCNSTTFEKCDNFKYICFNCRYSYYILYSNVYLRELIIFPKVNCEQNISYKR